MIYEEDRGHEQEAELLRAGERIDRIGFGHLRLIQKPEEFCYGVDAVILADLAAKKPFRRLVDLGTGTGVIPLILSHKTNARQIWGVEYQQASAERARRNVRLNGLAERVHIVQANVAEFPDGYTDSSAEGFPRVSRASQEKTLLRAGSAETVPQAGWADAVTANPPYMAGKCGLTGDNQARTIARHETVGTLADFVACASRLLRDRGDFYLIHRPHRLVDIFTLCRQYGLEPKTLRPVAPQAGKEPNLILLHSVKGGGVELKIKPPLYVYRAAGIYSDEIEEIYERNRETD